jgi:hypothetical protein
VHSSSTEDPEYPARDIQIDYSRGGDMESAGTTLEEEYQKTTRGWASKKFCTYPQEIVLQLTTPTRVKLIQILSH